MGKSKRKALNRYVHSLRFCVQFVQTWSYFRGPSHFVFRRLQKSHARSILRFLLLLPCSEESKASYGSEAFKAAVVWFRVISDCD